MPQLKENMHKCICDIHDWYCKNHLAVNECKSNVMLVATRERLHRIEENKHDIMCILVDLSLYKPNLLLILLV